MTITRIEVARHSLALPGGVVAAGAGPEVEARA
jgi:hypothetical protein